MYPAHDTILILDFGSQYTQLIAHKVREQNVHSSIVRPDVPVEDIRRISPGGIIFSGGPSSIDDAGSPGCAPEVRGVNRVVYDISTKPPATIEWE